MCLIPVSNFGAITFEIIPFEAIPVSDFEAITFESIPFENIPF